MAEVGDRIVVAAAKGAPSKRGRVIAESGPTPIVRWDNGHESAFVPGPGPVIAETGE